MTSAEPRESAHPRLYLGAEDVEGLKRKTSSDQLPSAAWKRIEEGVATALARPLPKWSSRWEFDSGSVGQMRAVNFDDTRANFATSPLVTSFFARKLRDAGLFALSVGADGRPKSASIQDGRFLQLKGSKLIAMSSRGSRAVEISSSAGL